LLEEPFVGAGGLHLYYVGDKITDVVIDTILRTVRIAGSCLELLLASDFPSRVV
jgi:hypothetical protein